MVSSLPPRDGWSRLLAWRVQGPRNKIGASSPRRIEGLVTPKNRRFTEANARDDSRTFMGLVTLGLDQETISRSISGLGRHTCEWLREIHGVPDENNARNSICARLDLRTMIICRPTPL